MMIKLLEENRKFYNFFLETLKDLTNPEFPGKSWIDEEGHFCFSEFGEMCMHFLSPGECIKDWNCFSSKQRQALNKLYEMVEDYDEYLPDRRKTDDEIRLDPEWDKVRQFAKKVYDDVKHVQYVPDDD